MIENIVPESALVNEKLKEELISFFHKLEEEIILKVEHGELCFSASSFWYTNICSFDG